MKNALRAIVKRPTKIIRDGEKVTLMPGDPFPFDPDNRTHRRALETGRLALEQVQAEDSGPDIDEILARIEEVSGVGPAFYTKIEEAVRGDS